MQVIKRFIMVAVTLVWVSPVAWAEEHKPIQIRTFSVQDISDAVESAAELSQPKTINADFKISPVRKVKVMQTEPWMNYVQMNKNSVFLSVKF